VVPGSSPGGTTVNSLEALQINILQGFFIFSGGEMKLNMIIAKKKTITRDGLFFL
jgi:hypothetical protein